MPSHRGVARTPSPSFTEVPVRGVRDSPIGLLPPENAWHPVEAGMRAAVSLSFDKVTCHLRPERRLADLADGSDDNPELQGQLFKGTREFAEPCPCTVRLPAKEPMRTLVKSRSDPRL